MAFLSMRHDFRAPAFAPESSKEIYATALSEADLRPPAPSG